jgi:hypothetical protein
MDEQGEGHAARHSDKSIKSDASKASIDFSRQLSQCFSNLEAAIRERAPEGDEHISREMLMNLHDWASGKRGKVDLALSDMLDLGVETMRHVQATSNREAERALDDLREAMTEHLIVKPGGPSMATISVPRERTPSPPG